MSEHPVNLPWYSWYPGDHLRRTRGWPSVAKGAFRELLDAQWDNPNLPIDDERLRVIAGATPEEWAVAWPFLEPEFPVDGDRRQHYPLEILRGDSIRRHEAQRRGAAKTNAKRWKRDSGGT